MLTAPASLQLAELLWFLWPLKPGSPGGKQKKTLDIHLPARIALGIYHRIKTTHDLRVPVPTPVGSYWNPDIIPHRLNLEACCNEFQNLRFAGQISTGCWISYLNEKYPLIWDHHPISRCLKPQSRYQPFEYLYVLCIYIYMYVSIYICVCVYVSIYILKHTCTNINIYIMMCSRYIYMCVCGRSQRPQRPKKHIRCFLRPEFWFLFL